MKKSVSILLVGILLITSLFLFTGCGDDKDKEKTGKKDLSQYEEAEKNKEGSKKQDLSQYAGTYEGLYTKIVGDPDTEKVEDEEFSLELNSDGTGRHNRDDASFKVTWSLDGDKFKMTETFVGDPIEYTGTLKDGKLDIFNGDPDDIWTFEYVYEKTEK